MEILRYGDEDQMLVLEYMMHQGAVRLFFAFETVEYPLFTFIGEPEIVGRALVSLS